MSVIGELAKTTGFRGSAGRRIAEPQNINTLQSIDNSVPGSPTIRTSIDTYVSGQYVNSAGSVIEVMQRYTVFVAYSKGNQFTTMNEVRNRISQDFQQRYGSTFNISNVYVPSIPVPADRSESSARRPTPSESSLYGGSSLFRDMTRFEKARYDISTEKDKARRNIENIRERYDFR